MNYEEQVTCGMFGTFISGTGIAISVNDIQAIISIVVTIAGFIIGVLIPSVFKIVAKIKEAKADGKITSDEAKEIISLAKDEVENIKEGIEDAKKKEN